MTTQDYRPAIGETLFATLYDNDPVVIIVTGYHHDDRIGSERIYYTENKKEKSISLDGMKFYPSAPTNAKFFYIVIVEESEFMSQIETTRLGLFFNPEDAFQFVDDIESGNILPDYTAKAEFVGYVVIVEKVL